MKLILILILMLMPFRAQAQKSYCDTLDRGIEGSVNYEKADSPSYGELGLYYSQPNPRQELRNNWNEDKLDFRNWYVELHEATKDDLENKAKLSSLLPSEIMNFVLANWGNRVKQRNTLGCGFLYIYYKPQYLFVGCWIAERDEKKMKKAIYGLI